MIQTGKEFKEWRKRYEAMADKKAKGLRARKPSFLAAWYEIRELNAELSSAAILDFFDREELFILKTHGLNKS